MVEKKKLRPEELDYFLAAIAPVFIIGMIGSLVYFFIMVVYTGEFRTRLMWILGLYTLAAVLISRIAIEQSRVLSNSYLLGLSLATLAVAPQFFVVQGTAAVVSFLVLCVMLASVAWLADRITFDSTLIDERPKSSGVGLLQSLGLAKSDRRDLEKKKRKRTEENKEPANEKIRKHNPGVWVLYFALLAIPFFGMGQFFISNAADRRTAFMYLSVYLFCSLSLLVLISLLSLRKYLRERDVPMEMSFATRWLAIGMTSVAILVGFFSLLPIPTGSLLSMKLPISLTDREDLKANRWGWGKEGVKDERIKPNAPPKNGQQRNGEEQDNAGDPKVPGKGDKAANELDQGEPNDTPQENGAKNSPPQDKQSDGEAKQDQGNNQPGNKPQEGRPQQGNQEQQKPNQQEENGDRNPNAPPPAPQSSISIDWDLANLLRWLVMGSLLLVAIVYGLRYRAELVQYFRGIWEWILDLFGRERGTSSQVQPQVERAADAPPFPSFDSFSDPFAKGSGWTAEEQIRYLYRAIQSWGHEHRVTCTEDETPDEFVRRLSARYSEQKDAMVQLGRLVSRIAYARGRVQSIELRPMHALWNWMQGARARTAPVKVNS